MADTIRDLTALLALLADNTSGDISPQDMRDVLVSLHGVYGEIYVADGSTAQSSLGTTPTKMTGFAANGESSGTTPDHTNDQITVGTAGKYLVDFDVSFSGTGGATMKFHLRVNDGEQAKAALVRKLGVGGDVGNAGFACIMSLSANDVLTVYVETDNAGGTDSITPEDAHLRVRRIG